MRRGIRRSAIGVLPVVAMAPLMHAIMKVYREDIDIVGKLMKLEKNKKMYRELAREHVAMKKQLKMLQKLENV